MKILCTGNPDIWTIAHGVNKVFTDCEFVHKSNGYDFLTQEGLDKFRHKVKDFDVFINASRIQHGVQSTLLKIVREEWTKGHVINIGTTMEFHFFHHIDPECAKDKLKLRNLSLDMYDEQFRTTHLIVGGHKDMSGRGEDKLDSIHIANAIKWVLESSKLFHVPIISVENDFWNKGQEGSGCDWNELKDKGRDSSLYD
jgi:hypothetical protein